MGGKKKKKPNSGGREVRLNSSSKQKLQCRDSGRRRVSRWGQVGGGNRKLFCRIWSRLGTVTRGGHKRPSVSHALRRAGPRDMSKTCAGNGGDGRLYRRTETLNGGQTEGLKGVPMMTQVGNERAGTAVFSPGEAQCKNIGSEGRYGNIGTSIAPSLMRAAGKSVGGGWIWNRGGTGGVSNHR